MFDTIDDLDNTQLLTHFGTTAPYWKLSDDSDALELSDVQGAPVIAVELTSEQAGNIRGLTGVMSSLTVDLALYGSTLQLHLVGRRVDETTWRGTASRYDDTASVVKDLGKSLAFAELIVSEVNSLVIIMDSAGRIVRFNKLSEELSGLSEVSVLGKRAHDLFIPEDVRDDSRARVSSFFEKENCHDMIRSIKTKNGERVIYWRNTLVKSGTGMSETYLVCSGTDITEEQQAKARLIDLANNDTLTGLPNRHSIEERIRQAVDAQDGRSFGVLFLDLDNFKKVNDHYGHITGDALIKEVAQAIKGCLSENDVLARLGGDEFLIVTESSNLETIEAAASRILARMKSPFKLSRAEVYSGCSIGIALFPAHGHTLEELIRSADTAMYVAKEEGRGTYRVFEQEMNNKVSEYMWLDSNMRKALEENQFELFYQPKLSLTTGKFDSVEALVRWKHPERGMISPASFIPYAEESGLIVELGRWVINAAAAQAAEWRAEGLDLRIAINLSARQLKTTAIVEDFTRAILANGISPSLLDVELTESSFIEDESLANTLIRQFRDLGAQVHLDDFGTGYSSLSQLARLPLDVLKLDGSFISSIHTDAKAQALVRSMVAVGHELNLKIVAECVETQEQADYLKNIGVDYAQGYLFGKPMNKIEFRRWVDASKGRTLRLVA